MLLVPLILSLFLKLKMSKISEFRPLISPFNTLISFTKISVVQYCTVMVVLMFLLSVYVSPMWLMDVKLPYPN